MPGAAPAGQYNFNGYLGFYPAIVWNQSSLTFEKSGVDESGAMSDWLSTGGNFDDWPRGESVHEKPGAFMLCNVYPNPFNPATTIRFDLPQASHVKLKIFDSSGRLVSDVIQGWRQAGWHEVTFDGSGLSSGVYLYEITAGEAHSQGKLVLMK